MSNRHQKDQFRHEGFVHGFVAARGPKTPRDTLLVLEEAESAWTVHLAQQAAAKQTAVPQAPTRQETRKMKRFWR